MEASGVVKIKWNSRYKEKRSQLGATTVQPPMTRGLSTNHPRTQPPISLLAYWKTRSIQWRKSNFQSKYNPWKALSMATLALLRHTTVLRYQKILLPNRNAYISISTLTILYKSTFICIIINSQHVSYTWIHKQYIIYIFL